MLTTCSYLFCCRGQLNSEVKFLSALRSPPHAGTVIWYGWFIYSAVDYHTEYVVVRTVLYYGSLLLVLDTKQSSIVYATY